MDKIIERLNQMAMAGNKDADAILMTVDGLNQNELADYVMQHDKELRSLLGVKYLVEKDSNTDLAKSYFDLLNMGREQASPDKGKKQGYYGEELHDVPYFMERFGISKEGGKYSTEAQADFVNAIDKLDDIELANLAWAEGYEGDAERMRDDIRRAGMMLQQNLAREGFDPTTGGRDIGRTVVGGVAGLVAPRVHEANLAGQEPGIRDYVGDVVEGGLNFVPGFAAGSKAVRAGSKMLPKVLDNVVAKIGASALESAAVPLGSQAYDYAFYDKDDPRGQWDWGRIGAQYGGAIGAKGALKLAGSQGKNVLEQQGKAAAEGPAHRVMETIENIGDNASENIARRQLALERKAELAQQADYNSQNFLTAKQNKSGYFATADDLADAEDFAIRKAEAERFANTQKARKEFDKNTPPIEDYNVTPEGKVTLIYNNGSTEQLSINPAVIPQGEDAVDKAIIEAYDAKYPAHAQRQTELAKKLSDYGDYPEIVQLPDGRFVKMETIQTVDGVPTLYPETFGENAIKSPNITMLANNTEVTGNAMPTIPLKNAEGEQVGSMAQKPRDYTVRRALNSDPDFAAVASGRAKWQPLINTATNALFNAGAREGIVGEGLDLDSKRANALWNKQLLQLRKLVTDDQTVEQKRQMVDAIMNVMTYGLDNLPDGMFKANPNAYRAIARQLGSSDWKHSSEVGVQQEPTTSYSSAF